MSYLLLILSILVALFILVLFIFVLGLWMKGVSSMALPGLGLIVSVPLILISAGVIPRKLAALYFASEPVRT